MDMYKRMSKVFKKVSPKKIVGFFFQIYTEVFLDFSANSDLVSLH